MKPPVTPSPAILSKKIKSILDIQGQSDRLGALQSEPVAEPAEFFSMIAASFKSISCSSLSQRSAMSSTISQREPALAKKSRLTPAVSLWLCRGGEGDQGSSRLVNISSLIPLNFFSKSPRKSSIASASFVAASLGPVASEPILPVAPRTVEVVFVRGGLGAACVCRK